MIIFTRTAPSMVALTVAVGMFVVPGTNGFMAPRSAFISAPRSKTYYFATTEKQEPSSVLSPESELDQYLHEGKLDDATKVLQKNPTIEITRQRWRDIFDSIEDRTAEADENFATTGMQTEPYPPTSKARLEMTSMYLQLKRLQHLSLFGAVGTSSAELLPAEGSKVVTPTLLEQITNLTMASLTPKPSNTLLYAGIALAFGEGFVSLYTGVDLNVLVVGTLFMALLDKILVNGAVSEGVQKVLAPQTTSKIITHEAGHFLCAYLLGCPVEGCVLSAWAALKDARFGGQRTGVSAGTSFFDPELSQEINLKRTLSRASIDRYSIIVMAGIAAEAIQFGQADGGAGDEMALVQLLGQISGKSGSANNAWSGDLIRNQARWGVLQAILILREYKPCHDALMDALTRGGDLGDCIYAIEKAARDNNLKPLSRPKGFILEEGLYGEWTTELPSAPNGSFEPLVVTNQERDEPKQAPQEVLQEYRATVEEKLKDIERKLQELDNSDN